MKPLICSFALVLTSVAIAADEPEVAAKPEQVPASKGGPANTKHFAFDCEKWAEGVPPKEVFVVDGTIRVAKKDGNSAIMIDASPIVDANAQLGDSSNGTAAVEARFFASKKGRAYPRYGVSVHGMSGYRLIMNCAKKEIELVKNEAVVTSAPFAWATDTWVHLKLQALQHDGKKWTVTAKAWGVDAKEPADPLITHDDDTIKGQGKAAVWGTPFSEMPIFIDDVKVDVTSK